MAREHDPQRAETILGPGTASPADPPLSAATAADPGGSNADRIVTELQRRVITGDVPVGSWLRHAALAEEFGVSRTPVREALRVLHAQGVVTIVPNRGAQVNGLSSHDIRELGEVRSDLQGLAAFLAAERISDEEIGRMRSAWDEFRAKLAEQQAGRDVDLSALWVEANQEFHTVVVDAARNRQLTRALADLHRRVPRNLSFLAYAGSTHRVQRNLAEHDELARLIAAHDAPAARLAMTAHFKHGNESTARWVESRQSASSRQD